MFFFTSSAKTQLQFYIKTLKYGNKSSILPLFLCIPFYMFCIFPLGFILLPPTFTPHRLSMRHLEK